ncbi:D-ribitol-5-phosphate cytidylyltransferase [Halotydeus destructor]|nr:D-ribitol-5-phosphate cytidylyltransferase [Halotydeus destructor]
MKFEAVCKLSIVIPAAGNGERIGSAVPKQFTLVNGLPLIYHTITGFEFLSPQITEIVIVISENGHSHMDKIRSILPPPLLDKVKVVSGDDSRHRSIKVGLNSLIKGSEITIIHDAVRPLVDQELLVSLIDSALTYGASGPVCKLTSTVLRVDDEGFLKESLIREDYRASEMPQVFRTEVIKDAFDKASDQELNYGTECLDLVIKYTDSRVKLIEGDANVLWKVTYRKDLPADRVLSCIFN